MLPMSSIKKSQILLSFVIMPGRTPTPEIISSWPKPNYVNPVVRGNDVAIVTGILMALAIILLGLRLWARCFIIKRPGWDDSIILVSLVEHTSAAHLLPSFLTSF